ncbi:MAG TPA: hypothetical protein DDY49_06520 [Paenibacillaceae bacterium]|nr:hypothetical protein [Paenibacillaceae bacterium]
MNQQKILLHFFYYFLHYEDLKEKIVNNTKQEKKRGFPAFPFTMKNPKIFHGINTQLRLPPSPFDLAPAKFTYRRKPNF